MQKFVKILVVFGLFAVLTGCTLVEDFIVELANEIEKAEMEEVSEQIDKGPSLSVVDLNEPIDHDFLDLMLSEKCYVMPIEEVQNLLGEPNEIRLASNYASCEYGVIAFEEVLGRVRVTVFEVGDGDKVSDAMADFDEAVSAGVLAEVEFGYDENGFLDLGKMTENERVPFDSVEEFKFTNNIALGKNFIIVHYRNIMFRVDSTVFKSEVENKDFMISIAEVVVNELEKEEIKFANQTSTLEYVEDFDVWADN